MSAGGEDVPPAWRADRRGIASPVEDFRELFDRFPVRALVGAAGPGVERDEVDLG